MVFADIPKNAKDSSAAQSHLPAGAIINGDLTPVHEVDVRDPEQIREFVDHHWQRHGEPGCGLLSWDGMAVTNYGLGPTAKGSLSNTEEIDEAEECPWVKAPRRKGHTMEIRPLAR